MKKIPLVECWSFAGSAPRKFEGVKRYISTGALDVDHVSEKDVEFVTFENRPSRANLEVDEGDILFAKMANTEKTFIVDSVSVDDIYSTGFCAVRADENKILSKCLYYFLSSSLFLEQKDKNSSGATQKAITNSGLSKIYINLPELTEQKEFIEQMDSLTSLISTRQKQLQKLDELVKARFVELFGDQKYPPTSLIELIEEGAGLSYGIVVPGDNVEDGVPMIRPSDFKNDNLCLDNVYRVAPEIEVKYARTRLIGNEILVQVIGQPGQIMLSNDRCKGMNVTRNLAVIRPDCNRINRIYLKTYMQTQKAQAFMLGETKQSTLKQLPLGRLKELEVPVPSMELQNQFADFVKQTDKSKLEVQKSLEKLELLKKALMQKYFG